MVGSRAEELGTAVAPPRGSAKTETVGLSGCLQHWFPERGVDRLNQVLPVRSSQWFPQPGTPATEPRGGHRVKPRERGSSTALRASG